MGKKKSVIVGETEKKEVVTEDKVSKKKSTGKNKKLHVRSKKYRTSRALVDHKKTYALASAIELMKKAGIEHFNSSVELHLLLDESGLKGEVTLPHGTGKEVRVAIFDTEIEKKLEDSIIEFDVLIAQPGDMKQITKFAKLLGPRGLMPSPKKGTVTDSPEKAVKKFKGGTFQFKTEPKFPLIHQVVGKREFTDKQLNENITVFVRAVGAQHIQKAYIASSMSPSVVIDLASFK